MSGKVTKSGEQVRLSAVWSANEKSSGAVRIRSWWLNQSELSCGVVGGRRSAAFQDERGRKCQVAVFMINWRRKIISESFFGNFDLFTDLN
ncbi:hypothetical protein AVEN_98801-1 [Araneus ventricosus]|uniref:Uncharacterized protein n=1 Tax=Araneus ventricosus TaxID=182803 RepID=A0A4Y2VW70_ARAVE|nr:hypothetical protein AVEN_98801-1 [Araneus ventricosus]